MKRTHALGDLQLAILQVLWQRGEATVAEVQEDLRDDRPLAITTIATMLVKMEKRGVLDHRVDGRRFVYRPKVSEEEVRRSMVDDLTEKLFEGSVASLVSHLLVRKGTTRKELDELRRLLAEREKDPRSGGGR